MASRAFCVGILLAVAAAQGDDQAAAAQGDDDDDMDCEMSDWGEWGACDVSCGGGWRFRKRTIKTPALGKGAKCPTQNTQRQQCDAGSCPDDEPAESEAEKDDRKVITSLGLDLTRTQANGARKTVHKEAMLHDGDDVAISAFRFCSQNGLNTAQQVVQIGQKLLQQAKEQGYEPPKKKFKKLVSSAAYANRAKKLAKQGDHLGAGADYTRAAMFEGMGKKQEQKAYKKLEAFMTEREAESRKEAEEAARKKKEKEEKQQRKEAKKLAKAEMAETQKAQEQAWQSFHNSSRAKSHARFWGKGTADGSGSDEDRELVAEMGLSLTRTTNGKESGSVPVQVQVAHGIDAAHAAFHFCTVYELPPSETLKITGQVQSLLTEKDYDEMPVKKLASAGEYLDRAQKLLTDGSFSDAGADFARAVHKEPGLLQQAQAGMTKAARLLRLQHEVELAYDNRSFPEAMRLLRSVQEQAPRSRNATRMLLQAQVHSELQEWAETVKECRRTLSVSKKRGQWKEHQPRTIAVVLGARAAMQMGDSEKALDFYRTVLKNDPENGKADKEYKRMRALLKLLDKAEKHLTKGYNHKALQALEEALLKLHGSLFNTPKFRSRVLIKTCRARSEVKAHEKALSDCNDALEYLGQGEGEGSGGGGGGGGGRQTFMSGAEAAVLMEAYEARARAHFNDENYGESMKDYEQAIELQRQTPGQQRGTPEASERRNELHSKLHEAQNKQRMHSEERRDHAKVLELPVNIHEVNLKSKCSWLKKQHKKLAKKWHPDKHKGDKRRAARKMDEISAAKGALVKQWGCKGIR